MNRSAQFRPEMISRMVAVLLCVVAATLLPACFGEDPEGPPQIRLGDSVCIECNMIISDARFATATIVLDARGRRLALLFDDFNCMVNHAEGSGSDMEIVERWVRDHTTGDWVRAEDAHFVHAQRLRTPMASHTAAFIRNEDALKLARDLDGEVMDFARVCRVLLGLPCCQNDETTEQVRHGETSNHSP